MKTIIYLSISIVFVSISSCKKFVDIPNPSDQILKNEVFTSDQSAASALVGIYSDVMADVVFSSQMTVAMSLASDELTNRNADINVTEFYNNSIQPTNSNNLSIWSALYKGIYDANSAIEGLTVSRGLTDSTKSRLLGEAKFIRAFCNFYLVNLWGDVPLVMGTEYHTNSTLPRSSKADVYNQIISDLQSAQTLLSATYISQNKTRPNKWTATAMLARVYLFVGDYANAESQASEVISNGGYSLSAVAQTFKITNSETIWQIYPVRNTYTWLASSLLPANATTIPTYPISPSLLSSFESFDARKTSGNWLKSVSLGNPSITYNYPYKYTSNSGTTVTECLVVFRLAEQFLIRAEARTMQNNITGAQADINIIRARANLGATAANSQATLLSAIEKERFTELFTEWGDRWLTLKRTNRAEAVLGIVKGINWQSTDIFWPIPQSQIDADPFLTQNLGY